MSVAHKSSRFRGPGRCMTWSALSAKPKQRWAVPTFKASHHRTRMRGAAAQTGTLTLSFVHPSGAVRPGA